MSNKISFLVIAVIAVIGALVIYYLYGDKEEVISDAKKFASEYTLVDEDNVFVYKNLDEIITTLESGDAIIYLGFPECPWCQKYVKYLNDVAKEYNIKEIYYNNIYEARKNNTEKYQKVVSLTGDNLHADDDGNKRIFVPDVTFVKNGSILYHDNETSVISNDITPEEYWTQENIDLFKTKMRNYFSSYTGTCSTCN